MQRAFVLHQRPYRESSQLVELFAQDSGRVGVVARGARRPKSAWRGLLQAFQPLLVEWRGRGDLATLCAAEPACAATRVPGARVPAGWYVNELMLRLLQRADPHAAVFDAYAEVVAVLGTDDDLDPALRHFEVLLLRELGYAPLLEREAETMVPVERRRTYFYWRDHGPVPADIGVRDDAPGAECLEVSGATLVALCGGCKLAPECYRDAKQFTRFLLEPLIGERALRTRSLLLEGPRNAGR